jgi:hypothetical protein
LRLPSLLPAAASETAASPAPEPPAAQPPPAAEAPAAVPAPGEEATFPAVPPPPPQAPAPLFSSTAPAPAEGAPPSGALLTAGPHACRNHPDVTTDQTCAWCRNPFCDQCLVEFRGVRLCAWCKQASLVQMQSHHSRVDPRQVVMWARVYDAVVAVGSLLMLGVMTFQMAVTGADRSFFFTPGAAFLQGLWGLMLIVPAVLLVASAVPALAIGPGKSWAYMWQTILLVPSALLGCLCAGCWSILLWPAAIVLMVYWIKPEVKEYCENG